MNKDIKTDWLFLLRSGAIDQGTHKLHIGENDSFCCLGVLCELAVAHGVIEKAGQAPGNSLYGGHASVLPLPVMKWAELNSNSPTVKGKYLTTMNDEGESFNEIADLIEKHL